MGLRRFELDLNQLQLLTRDFNNPYRENGDDIVGDFLGLRSPGRAAFLSVIDCSQTE